MTRKEFLELLGITTAVTCLGCTKNPLLMPENGNATTQDLVHGQVYPGIDTLNPNPQTINRNGDEGAAPKVDFTINLAQSQYQPLQFIGGFAYANGIIIAKIATDQYIAASEYCTHNGITIEYNIAQTRYECPAHGSQFANNGVVISGPALENIKTYKTELNSNMLRVFEE